MKIRQKEVKKLFRTVGSCSHTFFYIVNREFDEPKLYQEKATDPLEGGIMQIGYQYGMLWGASMGAAAEASRRFEDKNNILKDFSKHRKVLLNKIESLGAGAGGYIGKKKYSNAQINAPQRQSRRYTDRRNWQNQREVY